MGQRLATTMSIHSMSLCSLVTVIALRLMLHLSSCGWQCGHQNQIPNIYPQLQPWTKKSSFPLFDNNTTCKIAYASAIIVYNIMAFQLVLCFLPLRASPFLEVSAFLLIQCLMMAWNQWQTECLLCCNRQYQLMIWPLHKLY